MEVQPGLQEALGENTSSHSRSRAASEPCAAVWEWTNTPSNRAELLFPPAAHCPREFLPGTQQCQAASPANHTKTMGQNVQFIIFTFTAWISGYLTQFALFPYNESYLVFFSQINSFKCYKNFQSANLHLPLPEAFLFFSQVLFICLVVSFPKTWLWLGYWIPFSKLFKI